MNCSCKPPVGAPTSFTYLPNGQTTSTTRIGDYTRITDPYQEQLVTWVDNTTNAEVLIAEAGTQDCVHVELADKTWFECSKVARIPTQSGEYILAKDLLGHAIPTATQSQLSRTHVPFTWTAVVSVTPIGPMPVMYTYVNERDFWISGDGAHFVLMRG